MWFFPPAKAFLVPFSSCSDFFIPCSNDHTGFGTPFALCSAFSEPNRNINGTRSIVSYPLGTKMRRNIGRLTLVTNKGSGIQISPEIYNTTFTIKTKEF
jgi:hypothetical protein